MNGDPVAISWVANRKTRERIQFLSPQARLAFVKIWDRYVNIIPDDPGIVSDDVLSIPIAPKEASRYKLRGSEYPQLDVVGAAAVVDRLRDGHDVTDVGLLHAVDEILRDHVSGVRIRISEMEDLKLRPAGHLSPAERADVHGEVDHHIAMRRLAIDRIETEMLPLVIEKIEGLRAFPAA